jgi:chromosome partitioning protein
MEKSRLVPVTEMARRLGVTRERVRQMILEGKLEAVRLGHFWYVRKGGRVRLRRVFTFLTHAGSAGKTSLARDLGYELARRGFSVLFVDTDSQVNLTSWLGMRDVRPEEALLYLVETGQLPRPRVLERWR